MNSRLDLGKIFALFHLSQAAEKGHIAHGRNEKQKNVNNYFVDVSMGHFLSVLWRWRTVQEREIKC